MGEVVDPVCGMKVDPQRAAATSEHAAKLYYFCSPSCKKQFDKDASRYVAGGDAGQGG